MFEFTEKFKETFNHSVEWIGKNSPDFVFENTQEYMRYVYWLEAAVKQLEALALQQQTVIKVLHERLELEVEKQENKEIDKDDI